MLLRYLKRAKLQKATRTKRANGTPEDTFQDIGYYKVQVRELDDEVSASVYGANLYKMIRIKSVREQLETYLKPKVANKADNISNYYIVIDDRTYKIKAVNATGIDLELSEMSTQVPVSL